MEFKDYYQIMGISRDVSQDEIKRAYRKLARKYHPDVSKEPNAEEKFKELGEAYEVLKDPEKRAAYDRIAAGRRHGERFTPPPDWDFGFDLKGGESGEGFRGFSDFFESLFGGMPGRTGRAPHAAAGRTRIEGQDQYARIDISLDTAYHGGTQSITLTFAEVSPDGTVRPAKRTLNVKIPKGVREGQHMRLPGQGSPGLFGGANGDLYLEIGYQPHRLFRAEGGDIMLDLPVTPWEAALGETVTVPTLGGKVELKLPVNAQAGQKLRLKGRGLPGHPPGDQYVILRIVAPPAVTEEAKALYRRMAQTMPLNPREEMGV